MRIRFDYPPRFERERVLLAQRLDIHKRISGVFPRPPRCSCVTIVTQMTLMTLFLGYPFTISQILRHQRHLRHSDFVFFVISLFLFRAVVNCKRHFAISVTVMTMMTVFVGQGKGVYQKHRHHRQHRHLKQASRFNLRLACFILSNVAGFLPRCLLKWIQIFCKSARFFSTMGDMLFLKYNVGVQASS